MASDWELLDRYAAEKDQEAFAELARRHVDMVYGVARRCLGASGGAEDVTQAVFLLLSQKAKRVPRRGALAGWLFRATRYCCADVKKSEGRRKRHEREAGMQRQEAAAMAEELGAELDAALERLGEKERQAILVRFLEGKSVAETGAMLGISEAAAEKRVERGLGKLRRAFERRGFVVPMAGVMAVLMAESAKAAPVGLAASAAAATCGASVTVVGIAKGAAVMMKLALAHAVTIVVAGTIVIGAGIYVGTRMVASDGNKGAAENVAARLGSQSVVSGSPSTSTVPAAEAADAVQVLVDCNKAFSELDAAGCAALLHASNDRDEQDFKSYLEEQIRAAVKIRDSLIAQKVPEKDAVAIATAITNVNALTADQLKGATATVDGNEATVQVPGVLNFPPVPMVRVAGKWQISVRKTMDLDGIKTAEDMERFREGTRVTVKAWDETARQIRDRNLKTLAEVKAAFEKLMPPPQ